MKAHRFTSVAAFAALSFFLFGAASIARADSLKVDSVHSAAGFMAHHFDAGYVMGLLSGVNGTVKTGDDPSFDISIDVNTIETKNEKRNDDLKSADWFDVKQYPTMTFKSTAVKTTGKDMEVTGDLTIHGVTKSVTVTMTNTGTGQGPDGKAHTGFLADFKVNRTDFKIAPKAPGTMVGDEVRIVVALECVPE